MVTFYTSSYIQTISWKNVFPSSKKSTLVNPKQREIKSVKINLSTKAYL